MKRPRAFASLQFPNYRKYFAVQAFSSVGIWFGLIAQNWLVVELTDASGLALGITAALQFGPMLLLGLYAGVLVDRLNRRRVVMVTQTLAGSLALSLWFVVATGIATLWIVWLAVGLLGVVNAVDIPAREAFTKELVGRDHVANAVALNNGVLTAGRMAGPAAAGLLIAAADTSLAFLVNACTYGVVVLVLTQMNIKALFRSEPVARQPGQAREGLRYIREHDVLKPMVVVMLVAFTFAYNFQVLLPILAAETFGGGSSLFGYLMSAMGAGALVGSLLAASLAKTGIRYAMWTAGILAVAQFAVAASPEQWSAAGAAMFMGIAAALFQVTCSGTLQRETEEQKRGRVMAVYSISFTGTGMIGGPLIGAMAEAWGPRSAFVAAGIACVVAASLAWMAPRRALSPSSSQRPA